MPLQSILQRAAAVLPLPFKKGSSGPQLTREQALSARPVRNPSLKWHERDDGEIEVTLPRRSDLTGKLLAWLFFVPESRPVLLDEVGAFVWTHSDGTRTVSELVQLMADEYQMGKREVELSLTDYLKTLGKRGMVGFLVSKDVAEELGEEGQELVGLDEVGGTEEDLRRAQEGEAEGSEEEEE